MEILGHAAGGTAALTIFESETVQTVNFAAGAYRQSELLDLPCHAVAVEVFAGVFVAHHVHAELAVGIGDDGAAGARIGDARDADPCTGHGIIAGIGNGAADTGVALHGVVHVPIGEVGCFRLGVESSGEGRRRAGDGGKSGRIDSRTVAVFQNARAFTDPLASLFVKVIHRHVDDVGRAGIQIPQDAPGVPGDLHAHRGRIAGADRPHGASLAVAQVESREDTGEEQVTLAVGELSWEAVALSDRVEGSRRAGIDVDIAHADGVAAVLPAVARILQGTQFRQGGSQPGDRIEAADIHGEQLGSIAFLFKAYRGADANFHRCGDREIPVTVGRSAGLFGAVDAAVGVDVAADHDGNPALRRGLGEGHTVIVGQHCPPAESDLLGSRAPAGGGAAVIASSASTTTGKEQKS